MELNNTIKQSLPNVNYPKYKFCHPGSLLFVTGAPLSGKSTISSIIASSIEGCATQSMDIIRLLAQEVEGLKKLEQRSPFVNYGSCDSYLLIDNGSYSPSKLIKGYNLYSQVICRLLFRILPKLEKQGVNELLVEGVQLMPKLVEKIMKGNDTLVIIAADKDRFHENRKSIFGKDKKLNARYSTNKLLLIQQEILKQAKSVQNKKIIVIRNNDNCSNVASVVIKSLLKKDVINTL